MPRFLPDEPEITLLLGQIRRGQELDDAARLRLLYEALRAEARHQVTGRKGIGATELAGEVWLKLFSVAGQAELPWRDRDHFFSVASRAMRNLSIDAARRQRALCRGGGRSHEDAALLVGALRVSGAALAQLHEGLDVLRHEHERSAVGFELHVFAGWSVREIAAALGVSPATAYGDLTFARAVLQRHLDRPTVSGSSASVVG